MGGKGRYGGKGSKGKQVNTSTKGGVRPGAALALPNRRVERGGISAKRCGFGRRK